MKTYDLNEEGVPTLQLVETTCGRILFNERVPREVGYINDVMTKKALRDMIGEVLKISGTSRTAQFLDDIKELGYDMAFKGGLSFNLDDIIIPKEKGELVLKAENEVKHLFNVFDKSLNVDSSNETLNKKRKELVVLNDKEYKQINEHYKHHQLNYL